MRIVASVQAKRGSSRGLVHYVAHSKLDAQREPAKVRELFNAFADNLSVTSANNSMKVGIVKGRPSNDELHHLVLSFRREDYRKLGAGEKQRRRVLKDTTRAAMHRLETALSADRLSWAAAVHLNTANPHVHIALQKQYFTHDLEREILTKIPREALPHFEPLNSEKVFTPGFLIDAATKKMELLIARHLEQTQAPEKDRDRDNSEPYSSGKTEQENDIWISHTLKEGEILRRGIIAEYELHRIDSKIKILTDHGDKMRFRVSDPVSGQKRRLSLQDLEHRDAGGDPDQRASSERQIRTILFKMLGKEEVLKEQMQSDSGKAIREADRVRTVYRHSSRKLPVPSFTKEEIDKLQEYCIEAADIRRFSYLEGVRSDLERTGKIEPRSKDDLHRLAARKTISDLTINRIGRERDELNNRRYYRFVDIGDRRVSLAQLDREGQAPGSPVWSFLEKLKSTALRLSGKGQSSTIKTESDRPRSDILRKLDEELTAIEKDLKAEKNKAKFIGKILTVDPKCASAEPVYSIEQLAEIDALSLRLKLKPSYEKNWVEQRTLIESATSDSPAARRLLKANPRSNLSEHKTETIAGRALALEIVAKVELEKAKEDLKTFTKSRRFYKFGIADKKSVSVEFVSLHDVELPSRSSLLDRALNEVFDSREHRSLRRTVSSLVRAREQRLSDDVAAAKDILVSATRNSSEFKQFSLFGLRSESTYHPIFTFSEIRLLEIRATNTPDPKEAARLRTVLDSASDKPVHSLKDILRDFENPEIISAREREHPSVIQEGTSPQRSTAFDDTRRDPKEIRVQSNQDHSR